MQELDDISLLRQYVERNSEEAFAGLIARHINKVYSVALRHTRNPAQAEEITQAVFVILARKAEKLSPRVILSGWLYETARLTAVTFLRSEIRRARREQEALMQTLTPENAPADWRQIAPLLDNAMAALNETDRHAVVLRYFDGKSLREVGSAMGTSEDAAKKRVNRAVEKLQNFFSGRGIDSTADAISSSISTHAVQAAPATLAKAVAAVALGKGVAAGSSTLTLIKGTMKTMFWTKLKFAALTSAGLLIAAGGVTAVVYETQPDGGGSATTSANGPVEMKIRWVMGKKYTMRIEFHQGTSLQIHGLPEPVKSAVDFALDFDVAPVKELGNGRQQLELTLQKNSLNVIQRGTSLMNYDSTDNSGTDENPARSIVGARLEYFTDASGEVEKVEGVDELAQRVSNGGKSQAGAVYKNIFSEVEVKKYVSFAGALPNRTESPGQGWQETKDVSGWDFGTVASNIKYIFKNWALHQDRRCAHIESTGGFTAKTASSASGAVIKVKEGKVAGNIWFDPVLGMIIDSSAEETMTVDVSTQGGAFTPTVTQKIRMFLVDAQ